MRPCYTLPSHMLLSHCSPCSRCSSSLTCCGGLSPNLSARCHLRTRDTQPAHNTRHHATSSNLKVEVGAEPSAVRPTQAAGLLYKLYACVAVTVPHTKPRAHILSSSPAAAAAAACAGPWAVHQSCRRPALLPLASPFHSAQSCAWPVSRVQVKLPQQPLLLTDVTWHRRRQTEDTHNRQGSRRHQQQEAATTAQLKPPLLHSLSLG